MFQKQKATCFVLSPLQRLSLGIPVKTAIIKKSKRALDGGKSKKAGTSLPLFPFLLSPTRFLSTLARASLRHKDAAGGERVFCSNRVKTFSWQGLIHYIIVRQANFAFARVNYAHSSDVQRLLWSSHHHFPLKPSSASER